MSEMITFDIDDQVSRSLKKQEPVLRKYKLFEIYKYILIMYSFFIFKIIYI